MKHVIFWAICLIVTVPVLLGLMTDEITYGLFVLCWGAMWWLIFTHTSQGKKLFLKGYRMACAFMGDCDV